MAKYFGLVGYAETVEYRPGEFREVLKEVPYYGDVLSNTRRLDPGEGVNDDIEVNNRFSIVADQYAYEHFFAIRYINWMGARWKVKTVEVQRPRLILSIGGVYNGPIPETTNGDAS